MKKIKDIKIIILGLILFVFTIGYFIIANKISYAFANDFDIAKIEENKINIISKCAEKYGENHRDNFNDEGIIYITVQNLVDEGYVAANAEGKVLNLSDATNNLNDKKIRIKLVDNKITAEIYS